MIKASAHIQNNQLVIIGVKSFRWGVVPFTYEKRLEGEFPNGPVDVENGPENITALVDSAMPEIKTIIQKGSIKVAAENLVLRSRQGDQNATAMLVGVRENAMRGNPRARYTLKVIKRYIEDNPPSRRVSFGQENAVSKELAKHVSSDVPSNYCSAVLTFAPHVDMSRAIVLLANGPLIDNTLLERVASSLDERESKHFKMGYAGKGTATETGQLGLAFRKARGLQAARKGRFELFCPVVCWELGL